MAGVRHELKSRSVDLGVARPAADLKAFAEIFEGTYELAEVPLWIVAVICHGDLMGGIDTSANKKSVQGFLYSEVIPTLSALGLVTYSESGQYRLTAKGNAYFAWEVLNPTED